MSLPSNSQIEVSCLVSVYNSDHFMYGCLNDLVKQTLFQKGIAELVIIDSASPGNEAPVIERFRSEYPNIQYVRTDERETLYAAWNRAVGLAKGAFVTNANTDDRHKEDGLEKMLEALKANLAVDLVYANVYRSTVANQMFSELEEKVVLQYIPFSFTDVIFHYQFGCQPMWRKTVHDSAAGFFDPSLRAAGDWDFNFRFNLAGKKALHINEPLGLFYENPRSVSVVGGASAQEQRQVRQKYINVDNVLKLLSLDGVNVSDNKSRADAFCSLGMKALEMKLPWEPGKTFTDLGLAQYLFQMAMQMDPSNQTAQEGVKQCEELMRG